jgi:hypothetical protein
MDHKLIYLKLSVEAWTPAGNTMFSLLFLLPFALISYALPADLLGNFPLAVKTPYLHSWIASRSQTAPVRVWSSLYTNVKVSSFITTIGSVDFTLVTYSHLDGVRLFE